MLKFFQKHEKITLAFVVLIVLVFVGSSFFAGGGSELGAKESGHSVYAKALNDSVVTSDEMHVMKAFLSTDRVDSLEGTSHFANFFNSGVIRNDFILSGLSQIIFEKAPQLVRADFAEVVKSHNHFRPYVHPYSSKINVHSIWMLEAPEMVAELKKLTQDGESERDQFLSIVNLYKMQARLPSKVLREYLMFLEQQYGVKRDGRLATRDLNLFGASDISHWFGERFLEQICLFIHNTALMQESSGVLLSLEEVKKNLMDEGEKFVRLHFGKEGENQEIEQNWQMALKHLGLKEKQALNCWKKVMLFRKTMAEKGSTLLLDNYLFYAFNKEASKRAFVDEITLTEDRRFSSLRDLLSYKLYTDRLYADNSLLGRPLQIKTVSELQKSCPELLETVFEVEMREVDFDCVMAQMPLKEIKGSMLEDSYYPSLASHFDFLQEDVSGKEERYRIIRALSRRQQEEVESFIKRQIFDVSFDKVVGLIHKKRHFARKLVFVGQNLITPLAGVGQDEGKLFAFLRAMAIGDTAKQGTRRTDSNIYTEDRDHYYQILKCDLVKTEGVMLFQRAKRLGVISRLLDKELMDFYALEQENGAKEYKDEQGKYKSFDEVQLPLMLVKYAPYLSALKEKSNQVLGINWEDQTVSEGLVYPKVAFVEMLALARQIVISGRDLSEDFACVKRERRALNRGDKLDGFSSDLFSMNEGAWSDVCLSLETYPYFFCMEEITNDTQGSGEVMEKNKKFLAKQAKKAFVWQFAAELDEKGLFDPVNVL